jgi:signal transduction histidine kinase
MAGSHTDITERKKLEEERFNAIEKDAMLGRLAATVAHEVNNPLFAIKMQAETLKKRLAGDEAETGKVSLILDQVDRIARTVKGLLGLARRRDEGDSAVDLGAMIRNVLLLYDVGFVARNIRIRLELPAAPILIRANGDRIQQVFINLIENARQMITSGGEIGIVLRAVGNEVELTVEDNGPGFSVPAETLFAPDFSLRPGGTGLGLAIARRIVEEHAGAITAENRAEGGARFKVILPIKDREGCS